MNEDVGPDEDLFNAAEDGELDKLKELIAGGADPNGFKDSVRDIIAEAGRAPPYILCAAASHRMSAVRMSAASSSRCRRALLWFGAASSRRRPNLPPPPSPSSASAVAVARVVMTHTRSTGRATTPIPAPGSCWSWTGRAREMTRAAAGYFGRRSACTSESSSAEMRHDITVALDSSSVISHFRPVTTPRLRGCASLVFPSFPFHI